METELLRTFLEVNRTRHFARAASNLHLTQAAVSARVRHLEEIVGERLFTRTRNNIQLTVAGHRLLGHAEAIVGSWNRALLETGAPASTRALVALGCLPSIWETYLTDWLSRTYEDLSPILLQIELLNTEALVRRLREISITIGLLYEPPQADDLIAEQVTEVSVRLVSSSQGLSVSDSLPGYVYVDWGTSFAIAHDTRLGISTPPALRVDTPAIAYRFLTEHGGTAYLPSAMVAGALSAGLLFPVAGGKTFTRAAFIARSATASAVDSIKAVTASLRALV
jgi:DNA-binding transcriptional LysR family regulator